MGEESTENKRDVKTLWEYLEYKNDKYIYSGCATIKYKGIVSMYKIVQEVKST